VLVIFTAEIVQAMERCASGHIQNHLMETNEHYPQKMAANEAQFERILKRQMSRFQTAETTIYKMPVVVHVIHLGEAVRTGSNISDAQIQSAITILNEDFRKISGTNGDGNGVDVGIESGLAVRNENDQAQPAMSG